MDKQLKDFCELFCMNQEILRARYKWDGASACAVAAIEATARGKELDYESLKDAEELLKAETSIFSSYRGTLHVYVIAKLASSRYPVRLLEESKEAYQILKRTFSSGDYTALLSLLMPELCPDVENAVFRGKDIFLDLKEQHRFLTTSEDQIMAVLLAASRKGVRVLDDIEQCFTELKGRIKVSQDSRHLIAEVLSLGERDVRFNIVRFLRLHDELKEAGYKVPDEAKLTSLATLALSEIPIEDALNTIKAIDAHLARQKEYSGIFGFTKRERLAQASVLTSAYFGGYDPDNTAIISLVISMIAAAHAAAAAAAAA